jgi:hypothetical protein
MKRILITVAVLAALVLPVLADVSTQDISCTNTAVYNATQSANMGNAVKLDKTDMVGVMVRIQGNNAAVVTGSSSNVVFTFSRSGNGTTYETTGGLTVTNTFNADSAVNTWTPWTKDQIGAAGYIKLVSIYNPHSAVSATNVQVIIVKKSIKPSS